MIGPSNTRAERFALDGAINLSDGHARQPQTRYETSALAEISAIARAALLGTQVEAEQEFLSALFTLSREPIQADSLLSYSVSTLVTVVGTYLRERRARVLAVEPCFDNIIDLIRRAGVDVAAVSEARLVESCLLEIPSGVDAIWVTTPNNPTGLELTEKQMVALADTCARQSVLLILDCCFRWFSESMYDWDLYGLLSASGVDYVVFEDTGKAFPLLDVKVGVMVASAALRSPLQILNEEVLLNTSPLVLRLLAKVLQNYSHEGGVEAIARPNAARRRLALDYLSRTNKLVPLNSGPSVPFIWARVSHHGMDGRDLQQFAREQGLHILSGDQFYWTSDAGRQFIRIALARADDVIVAGSELLLDILRSR